MKHLNIQPKPIKHRGTIHNGENYPNSIYNANTFGKHHTTIRIWGVEANHVNGPQKFDRTFKIGDTVTYDSYNFIYLGQIVKIGPKTVTVKTDLRDNVRMDLFDFIRKNRLLDLETIEKENNETSMCV